MLGSGSPRIRSTSAAASLYPRNWIRWPASSRGIASTLRAFRPRGSGVDRNDTRWKIGSPVALIVVLSIDKVAKDVESFAQAFCPRASSWNGSALVILGRFSLPVSGDMAGRPRRAMSLPRR